VLIEVEFDAAKLDPAEIQGLVEETQRQVAEGMQQMIQAGQLSPELGQDQLQEIFEQNVNRIVVEQLHKKLWAEGKASGWADHDALLPLLQGASRGLQLALSAELPVLGSGKEKRLPMLTLTALEEGNGLRGWRTAGAGAGAGGGLSDRIPRGRGWPNCLQGCPLQM